MNIYTKQLVSNYGSKGQIDTSVGSFLGVAPLFGFWLFSCKLPNSCMNRLVAWTYLSSGRVAAGLESRNVMLPACLFSFLLSLCNLCW